MTISSIVHFGVFVKYRAKYQAACITDNYTLAFSFFIFSNLFLKYYWLGYERIAPSVFSRLQHVSLASFFSGIPTRDNQTHLKSYTKQYICAHICNVDQFGISICLPKRCKCNCESSVLWCSFAWRKNAGILNQCGKLKYDCYRALQKEEEKKNIKSINKKRKKNMTNNWNHFHAHTPLMIFNFVIVNVWKPIH